MKYYRLIFKNDEGKVAFSEIVEQNIDEASFNSMDWEKPIIRHFDGKYLHFLSLDAQYLECMLAGVGAYLEVSKLNSLDISSNLDSGGQMA